MTEKMETNDTLGRLYAELVEAGETSGGHSRVHCTIRMDDDKSRQHKAIIIESKVLSAQMMKAFDDDGNVGPLMLVVLAEGDVEEFVEEYCDEE